MEVKRSVSCVDAQHMATGVTTDSVVTDELRWVRYRLRRLLDGRRLVPFAAMEQAEYDSLTMRERTLISPR